MTAVKSHLDFLGRGWRDGLAEVVATACRSLLIVTPYIKTTEAEWLCDQVRPGVQVTTLTTIDSEAVGNSALDMAALVCLAEASPSAELVALPHLHAKVYVADEQRAIVTSGNLTQSGLDRNIEYGVMFRDSRQVPRIRQDMLAYSRMGSPVSASTIIGLVSLEAELREAHAHVAACTTEEARRRFDDVMRRAKPAFAALQVGDRSAHAVFGEAIRFVLDSGPMTTKAIQEEVRRLLPALCDDSEYFQIKGENYGRAWKRRLRHAQLHLRRKEIVTYGDGDRTWRLVRGRID